MAARRRTSTFKAKRVMARSRIPKDEGRRYKDEGRRYYDGSTKGVLAVGVGGGSVIGVLTALFMFMNAAPWAGKNEVEALRNEVHEAKLALKTHADGIGHVSTVTEMATLKSDTNAIKDTLREMKADIKDIKDRKR